MWIQFNIEHLLEDFGCLASFFIREGKNMEGIWIDVILTVNWITNPVEYYTAMENDAICNSLQLEDMLNEINQKDKYILLYVLFRLTLCGKVIFIGSLLRSPFGPD